MAWRFEVGRGGGASPDSVTVPLVKLGSRAEKAGLVSWRDYLSTLPLKSAQGTREPLPGGTTPFPLLILNHPPVSGGRLPIRRDRIWFDDGRGYLPLRLESQMLEDGLSKDSRYVTDSIVEWGDPVLLRDGTSFAGTALFRHFTPTSTVQEGASLKDWPLRYYEVNSSKLRFSNMRLNEPLDSSLFTINPPPGTHVLDEVNHEMYITGSAGEQLHKMALQLRNDLPPPERSRGPWLWFVAAIAVVVLGAGVWFYCRRSRLLRRPAQ